MSLSANSTYGRTIRKVMRGGGGGGGIFSRDLEFFSFNVPLRECFCLYLPPPPNTSPSLVCEWWDRTKTGLIFTFRAPLRKIYQSTHIDSTVLSTFNYFVFQLMPVASLNHFKLFQSCNNHTNEWLSKLFTENCWIQCWVTLFSLI